MPEYGYVPQTVADKEVKPNYEAAVQYLQSGFFDQDGGLRTLNSVLQTSDQLPKYLNNTDAFDEMREGDQIVTEAIKGICDKTSEMPKRLAAVRLIADMIAEAMGDNTKLQKKWQKDLKVLAENRELPPIITIFIQTELAQTPTSLMYMLGSSTEDRHRGGLASQHIAEYDTVKFEFNNSVTEKLLKDQSDNTYKESEDLMPVHKSSRHNPFGDYEIEEWQGDYIVRPMSLEYVGIYSTSGELVAWIPRENKVSEQVVEPETTHIDTGNYDLRLFKIMQSLQVRDAVEKQLGVSLSDTGLFTQNKLLELLVTKQQKNWQEIKQTILNIDGDMEKGAALVTVLSGGDKANKEVRKTASSETKHKLLKDYSAIVHVCSSLLQSIVPEIPTDNSEQKVRASEWQDKLLGRANKFLQHVFAAIEANPEATYDQIVTDLIKNNRGITPAQCIEGVVGDLVIELVNMLGDVKTREILDRAWERAVDETARQHIKLAYGYITPLEPSTEAIRNLSHFYEQIQFENYELNEKVNESEFEMLSSAIQPQDRVLDSGCGTGRLLLPLAKRGFKVTGLDYTERHVNLIKKSQPEIPVIRADWKNTGLPSESFDVVYSLGRSVLHESNLSNQEEMFAEAARILCPGGRFILDMPNREKGGYAQLVSKYAEVMTAAGITNFRLGTIYDSPDGKNFATRYAYSHEDIVKLAEDNGFEIVSVETKPLPTGSGDENIYYTLRKLSGKR